MPGTPVPQIRRIAFDQQEIGMGFNSDTGQVVGTALEFDAPTPAAGQEASATATIVTTHESLMESLNFSFEAEGRYGFSSVGVKADFAKSTTYNSVSTFVVARMVVQNQIIRGRNFRISQHAQDVLDREPFEVFTRAFGDSFVRGRLTGGEFYAVMRITSLETGLQTSLGVTLQAEINGGVAGGSFKGSLNTAMRDTRTKTEFNVTFYQRGGSGREEIGTTLSVDEIKDRLQSFPSAVANNPFPYQVELATYDTIPLDVPPKEQEELLLQTLADADKRKLEFIQQRNDFEFAAEHQEYFVDPPSPADCLAHAATYLRATNAVIAHLIGLSNGEIRPPQFFDPGALDPPIVFPAVQLRKKSLDDRAFRDWYLVRDDPSITQDDHMLVNAIANLAKERINDFDHIPEADRGAALEAVVTGFEEGRLSQIDVFENDQIVKLKSVEHLGGMLPSGITKLELQRNNLRSLRGIERFSKLTELDVAGNEQIDQLNEVGALPALRELRFDDNRVSDVTPLLACTQLEMVSLARNRVVDLTPLTQLTKLNTLLRRSVTGRRRQPRVRADVQPRHARRRPRAHPRLGEPIPPRSHARRAPRQARRRARCPAHGTSDSRR